jgi:transposase
MFIDLETVRIFICAGSTDMRKQASGLARIVQNTMGSNPFDGSLYVFCNKRKNMIKIVYWETNGFCCWSKRLEKDTFVWPKEPAAMKGLEARQLRLLLQGMDIWRVHKELYYSEVG